MKPSVELPKSSGFRTNRNPNFENLGMSEQMGAPGSKDYKWTGGQGAQPNSMTQRSAANTNRKGHISGGNFMQSLQGPMGERTGGNPLSAGTGQYGSLNLQGNSKDNALFSPAQDVGASSGIQKPQSQNMFVSARNSRTNKPQARLGQNKTPNSGDQ